MRPPLSSVPAPRAYEVRTKRLRSPCQGRNPMTDAGAAQPLRVVLHHDAGPAVIDHLDRLRAAGLDVTWCAVEDRVRLGRLLIDADVLLHVLDPVTDEL